MKTRRFMRTLLSGVVLLVPLLVLAATQLGNRPVSLSGAVEPAVAYASGLDYTLVQTSTNTFTPTPTNTPTHTPTPTDTPSGATVAYVDIYEPNNTLPEAATYPVDNNTTCGTNEYNVTLWPAGDVDYFRFVVKQGRGYQVRATIATGSNLDTVLKVFNNNGHLIAQNDDAFPGTRSSAVDVVAGADGYYYAEISNISPGDPAGQTYCFIVAETAPPNTATPTRTPDPGADPDACENTGPYGNGSRGTACLIGPNQELTGLNFVPVVPPGPDNDFYKIWVRQNLTYRCGTFIGTGSVADTNMIIYDQNGNGIAGNADRDLAAGDLGSEVTWTATYDGYLYVLVGPQNPPEYANSGLHTYRLECELILATATPTPSITPTFRPIGGQPSPTPFPSVTPFPTPTPIDPGSLLPTPTPRPVVQIVPLPTALPADTDQETIALDVQVYYDANNNFQPELTEGIMDVAVALYDAAAGGLLAYGTTNEAGFVRFPAISASGPVRVVIPFLNYAQTVAEGQQEIVLRVAPRPLPGQIP